MKNVTEWNTGMTHTICKFFFSRHEKYAHFFLFKKTIKITANNLMLFQYSFTFKIAQILSFLLKNIVLHQKLVINHQNIYIYIYFNFPDTLRCLKVNPL